MTSVVTDGVPLVMPILVGSRKMHRWWLCISVMWMSLQGCCRGEEEKEGVRADRRHLFYPDLMRRHFEFEREVVEGLEKVRAQLETGVRVIQ